MAAGAPSDPNDPGRIIGAEWAPKLPPSAAANDLRERPPCPICGHPTGDCTPHEGKP